MLVDFTVENFRSYRAAKTFSMVASVSAALPHNTCVVPGFDGLLLRSAAIYGANASGKSNLLAAMDALSGLLESPLAGNPPSTPDPVVETFALDPDCRRRPSRFQVRFVSDGTLYDYLLAYRAGKVEDERLSASPSGRPQTWFTRPAGEVRPNPQYLRGQKERLRQLTPPDRPFLAVAAAFGHQQLTPVAKWLTTNLVSGVDAPYFRYRLPFAIGYMPNHSSLLCQQDPSFRRWATRLLQHADLGIRSVDVEVVERELNMPGEKVHRYQEHVPYFSHVGPSGDVTRFRIDQESNGTRKLYGLLADLHTALRRGQFVQLDEFGESMHPVIAREILRLFGNPESNPKNAQLVVTTHDTSLLSARLFRRDQIWFAEKDASGATDLYSLQDIKDIDEGEAFEKDYLRGRYGAIPFLGPFDFPPAEGEGPVARPRSAEAGAPGAEPRAEENGAGRD